jgi:hypothetical protein
LKTPTVPWQLVEHSRNVHAIRFSELKSGWSQDVLLNSDAHWDNPHCVRSLLKKHFQEARDRLAPIIIYGDFLCAMQGKFDKRGNKDSVRAEHQHSAYFNRLVNTAADWLAPYAHCIAIIGPGNHETATLKHHEIDLCAMLVERLHQLRPGIQTKLGGFSGWVRFQFTTKRPSQWRESVRLWYHHGYGGGGPVTRGVIQTNRRAVYVEADVVVTGHTHDAFDLPIQRIALNQANRIVHKRQLHISTPGYKEEYNDGAEGFHNELGRPPKPIGGHWLTFELTNPNDFILSVKDRRAEPISSHQLKPRKWAA